MSLFSALHIRPSRGRSRRLCLGLLLLAMVTPACAPPAHARALDGASCGAATPRADAAVAKWTVIMYMCGDNNLAPTVIRDLDQQAARVGSTDAVQVVALADRPAGFVDASPDWQGHTLLFHVAKDMKAAPATALQDWGECDLGDPQTLADLVLWAKANLPAAHYALALWDHGWSWHPGWTMFDDSFNDSLDADEMRLAAQAFRGVDVVVYDTCTGGSLEVQAQWRGYADAFVGSEDFMGWNGVEFGNVLSDLNAAPGATADEAAVMFASSITDDPDEDTTTASAIRLDASWDRLLKAVDRLALRLRNGLAEHRTALRAARRAAQKMTDEDMLVDLYDAATQIQRRVADRGIRAACDDVRRAVDAATLFEWHKSRMGRAHGTSIWWPKSPAPHHEPTSWRDYSYYAASLIFAHRTYWDEFLGAWGR